MKLLIPCHNTLTRVLKKNNFLSYKHQDPTLATIFIGMGYWVESKNLFSLVLNLHLWYSHPAIAMSDLKYRPKKLAHKSTYIISIGVIRMRFSKLQDNDIRVKKLSLKKLSKSWKNIVKILHYQDLPYIPKIIYFKLINKYYNISLVGYFDIKKIQELIIQNYY